MNLRSLFFIMAFALALTAKAQITKGNWLVGGNGNASFSKVKYKSSSGNESTSEGFGFSLQPNIGYFPVDKFASGLSLRLNYAFSGDDFRSWGYGLGPFLRYYFLPTDKLVNVFSEAGYIFSTGSDSREQSFNTNRIDLKAGAVVFFTGSVGLEVTLNYGYSIFNDANSEKTISNRFSLGIGFQVHLKKK